MSDNKKIASLYKKIVTLKRPGLKLAVKQGHQFLFDLCRGALFTRIFGVDLMMRTAVKVNSFVEDDYIKAALSSTTIIRAFHGKYQADMSILLSSMSGMFPLILYLQPKIMELLTYLEDYQDPSGNNPDGELIELITTEFLKVSMQKKIDVLKQIITTMENVKTNLSDPHVIPELLTYLEDYQDPSGNNPGRELIELVTNEFLKVRSMQEKIDVLKQIITTIENVKTNLSRPRVIPEKSIWFDELIKLLSAVAIVIPYVHYSEQLIENLCIYITKDENKEILNVILKQIESIGVLPLIELCIINLHAIVMILEIHEGLPTGRDSRESSVESLGSVFENLERDSEAAQGARGSEALQGARGSEAAQGARVVTPTHTPEFRPQVEPEPKKKGFLGMFSLDKPGGKGKTRKNKRTRKRITRRKMRKSRKNKIK